MKYRIFFETRRGSELILQKREFDADNDQAALEVFEEFKQEAKVAKKKGGYLHLDAVNTLHRIDQREITTKIG